MSSGELVRAGPLVIQLCIRRSEIALLTKISPDLLAKIPPNAASMTPDQAKAYYKSLSPDQQQSVKQQAQQIKVQIDSVPGLMDKLKALLKSFRGS